MKNSNITTRYIGINALIFTALVLTLLIILAATFLLNGDIGSIKRHPKIFMPITIALITTGFFLVRVFKTGKSMVMTPTIYKEMSKWSTLHQIIGYTLANIALVVITTGVSRIITR
jgi:hypothetical protein